MPVRVICGYHGRLLVLISVDGWFNQNKWRCFVFCVDGANQSIRLINDQLTQPAINGDNHFSPFYVHQRQHHYALITVNTFIFSPNIWINSFLVHAPIFVYTKRIAVSSLSATRFDKYFPWKNISGHWKATQQQRRTISWRLDKYKWNIRICATRWSRWWYEQKAGLASGIETRIGQHPDRLNKYFWGALCGLTHTQPTHTSEWCVCVCVAHVITPNFWRKHLSKVTWSERSSNDLWRVLAGKF